MTETAITFESPTPITYHALALDPIHVGAGGYRIGRVDNTIVRDPATQLPKIPGTSIAGVCRAFSAMAMQIADPSKKTYLGPDGKSCAGKGGQKGSDHCCKSDCPICMTFGYSKPKDSFQGLAQFSDAMIFLFPVHSAIGTLWITSPACLEYATGSSPIWNRETILVPTEIHNQNKRLNLGWIIFDTEPSDCLQNIITGEWKSRIKGKIVLVSDQIFSNLVNSNLEIRTSVSIDPQTGAAEDKALFTYEAIPRGTVLAFSVAISDPRFFDKTILVSEIKSTIKGGFDLIKTLGIGGMNTRGMGRMSIQEGV